MSAASRRSRAPLAPLVVTLAVAACYRDAATPGRDAGTSAAEAKVPEVGIAHQTWSESLLADVYMPNVSSSAMGPPLPARMPPLLRADAAGTMWLLDGRGTLIRQERSGWARVGVEVRGVLGLAPQVGGGAVILRQRAGGFELFAIDRDGRARWSRSSQDLAAKHGGLGGDAPPDLLQDERGAPYLRVTTRPSAVLRVDAATGDVRVVVDLGGYAASVLVWQGAVYRILFDGTHRQWVRRPFGGADEVVLAGGVLDDRSLWEIAVAPDRGPVLTDGRRLVSIAPDGRERPIPLPALPSPAPPPPAGLSLSRAVARADGTLWVVYVAGAGWSVHVVPTL